MSSPNLFAQGLTNALYEAEFINRTMNVSGALHALASRSKLQAKLDSFEKRPMGILQAATRGALIARSIAVPVTLPLDMLFGTGRTHFAPGERPERKASENPISYELAVFKADFQNLFSHGHDERLEWLKNRLGQSLEHPCDTGLIGVIAGASALPMLFIVSAIGSIVGAVVGALAYLVQRATGHHTASLNDTVNDVSIWFAGVPSMIVRSFVPAVSVSFNVLTRVGVLSFDIGELVPMYLVLQGCRLGTVGIKIGVTAVGACVGACIGLGIVSARALQQSLLQLSDVDSLESTSIKDDAESLT